MTEGTVTVPITKFSTHTYHTVLKNLTWSLVGGGGWEVSPPGPGHMEVSGDPEDSGLGGDKGPEA